MEVHRYDELKREVGHLWFTTDSGNRKSFAIELLEQGLAWYTGEQFPGSETYEAAMEAAKAAKRGLWSQPDPVPPWEFYQKVEGKLRDL